MEDSLAAFYKTKHIHTIRSSNGTPWYLPKEDENHLHTDVYNSFIYNA